LEEGKKEFTSAAAVSYYCLLRGRVDFFAAGGGKVEGTAANRSSRRWQWWPDSGGCREKQSNARGGRKRGFPKDWFVILEIFRDLLVKTNLTTVLGLKYKCDQNKSCTTFRALQLCFRI
jgi:hypothetical protein